MQLRSRKSTASTSPLVPPPVVVRRLGPGDDAILSFLATENHRFGGLDERDQLDPLEPGDSFAFLRDERTAMFVAFEVDEPVGFLYACELYRRHTFLRHLCIYEIGVSDRHRNQGIGQALMDAVAEHARSEGIERGFVITNKSNVAASLLYESCGGMRTADDDIVFAFSW